MEAVIPTRGLIGFETDLVNFTSGHGIMSHHFREYAPAQRRNRPTRSSGVLVAMEAGVSTAYSLEQIQERGRLFIGPQEEIYEGMIIGENARPDDMPVNPCRRKDSPTCAARAMAKASRSRRRSDDSGTRARIHRAGRIRGSDAEIAALAQAHPRRQRAETRSRNCRVALQSCTRGFTRL